MPIERDGDNIVHREGSRTVWSTALRPALLLPDAAVTLTNFSIAFPDFQKSNAYGFDIGMLFGGLQVTTCASFASINPQEWDSGLSHVADLPSGANYFEVEVTLNRVVEPSTYLDAPIPKTLAEGQRHLLDGASAIVERIGPIVRMFRFERSGSRIYLRRKQSVRDAGNQGIWTPGNAVYFNNGGKREGWTYGGSPNAWPAYLLQAKPPGGNTAMQRGGSNACSLTDTSNYASTWRGTVTITPGYIAP